MCQTTRLSSCVLRKDCNLENIKLLVVAYPSLATSLIVLVCHILIRLNVLYRLKGNGKMCVYVFVMMLCSAVSHD